MNITSIFDNEINQMIKLQLAQFGQIHLLIDPKINDEFFFNNHYKFESVIPIRDRQDTVSADHECIQLCTINKATLECIEPLIDELKNADSSAIAIIFSSYSINDIQKQISNALFMRYEGRYYFLRFYDPKVLKHLVMILTQIQLEQLFGVIEYWYYWDDKYIQLKHKPERILSDIDLKITARQWQHFNMAQSYNHYEHRIIKQQNSILTIDQQQILTQLLDWTYLASKHCLDKNNLDNIIDYAMTHSQNFLAVINYDLFTQMINDKTNNIKQYFEQLDKRN